LPGLQPGVERKTWPDWTGAALGGYSIAVSINSKVNKLTPREREILGLVAHRLGDKEIARRLGLSPRTVQNHLHRAYEKLGVSDRQQAASVLSNSYSGELYGLSSEPSAMSKEDVLAGLNETNEGRKPVWPRSLYRLYAGLGEWRRPRKKGGSVLWLILGWAFAWIAFAVIAANLILPVLEMIRSLR
jgi:DNA-binding CsgD family transcriptional regulator